MSSDAGPTSTDIGSRLRSRRDLLGLTQHELSNRSGVSVSTIRNVENGHFTGRPYSLPKLIEALDLNVAAFLGATDSAEAADDGHEAPEPITPAAVFEQRREKLRQHLSGEELEHALEDLDMAERLWNRADRRLREEAAAADPGPRPADSLDHWTARARSASEPQEDRSADSAQDRRSGRDRRRPTAGQNPTASQER